MEKKNPLIGTISTMLVMLITEDILVVIAQQAEYVLLMYHFLSTVINCKEIEIILSETASCKAHY